MKIYIAIFLFSLISSVIGGGYLYYKDTQARLAQLRENNARLEVAAQTSQETIRRMEENYEQIQERTQELTAELSRAEEYRSQISQVLREHQLTTLTKEKPGLIETRVNSATESLLNEFVEITTTNP